MLRIEDRGVVFDATLQPDDRRIAFFTSLCELHSGVVLCGFQVGPGKHAATSRIGLCRSADRGRTWVELPISVTSTIDGRPGSLGCAELVEASPGRLLLFATWFDRTDPQRPLFDPVTEGILKSKQLTAVSTDEGHTWSEWREFNTGYLKACSLTGPVIRQDDGLIIVPFESFKEFDDPMPGRHAAWVVVSHDGGETFGEPQLVAQHAEHSVYFWDQRFCRGNDPDGLWAMFWTHSLAEQRDLNVHLQRMAVDGKLNGKCVLVRAGEGAGDGGGTPTETTIPGQIAAPCQLADGRLLAFVVDRGCPGTMTLWSSLDCGQSWPVEDRLVVHTHNERAALSQGQNNIDFRQYWEDMGKWSFGHPAIRQLADGSILLAWYAGSPDRMSIHRARVSEGH